jgi:hypothetical protein
LVAHTKECRLRVFENRVLTRKLYEEELNDLYCSPNTVSVIKSRRIRWAGHVSCMVERRDEYRVLVGYMRETGHLEDSDVERMIILIWFFRKWGVGVWNRSNWPMIWSGGRHL